MINPVAIAVLSLLENVTDKQYFPAWATFSSVVFTSYYRWPGRRVSLPSVRWRPIYILFFLARPHSCGWIFIPDTSQPHLIRTLPFCRRGGGA